MTARLASPIGKIGGPSRARSLDARRSGRAGGWNQGAAAPLKGPDQLSESPLSPGHAFVVTK